MYAFVFYVLCNYAEAWVSSELFNYGGFKDNSLRNYILQPYDYDGEEQLLIFGGEGTNDSDEWILRNDMYRIYLSLNVIVQIDPLDTIRPLVRKNGCSCTLNNKIYIYGGTNQFQQKLSDLWSFNLNELYWQLLSNNLIILSPSYCEISNYIIIIMGKNIKNALQIIQYSLDNHTTSNIPLQYHSHIEFITKLWDNTSQSVEMPIKYAQQISKQYPNLIIKSITTTNILIDSPICYYHNKNRIIIVMNNSCYQVKRQLEFYTVKYINRIDLSIQDNFQCQKIGQWLFIIQQSQNQHYSFIIQYYNTQNLVQYNGSIQQNHLNFQNSNQWPKIASNYYRMFTDQSKTLFLIISSSSSSSSLSSSSSMVAYKLLSNCSIPLINAESCFYGQIKCRSGYTGTKCLVPSCSNSLSLASNSIINLECSGNGICNAQGCLCKEYWTGSDCSIYVRVSCKGLLLYNFPILNCECNDPTKGGNSCQTRFCYNDCSGKGKCKQNGQCQCDSEYAGADCSILHIALPNYQLYLTLQIIFLISIIILFS